MHSSRRSVPAILKGLQFSLRADLFLIGLAVISVLLREPYYVRPPVSERGSGDTRIGNELGCHPN